MAVTAEIARRRAVAKDIAIGSPGICTRPELGHDGPCNGYPAETCWRHISTCPGQREVLTKLDDAEHGARNIDTPTVMLANGHFYLVRDRSTRCADILLYKPTHWRVSDRPVELSPVATRLLAESKARVSPAEAMAGQRLVTADTIKDQMAAARLLRAAAEDARLICGSLRSGSVVTMNQALVMQQILTNLNHAISAAESAGIARATDVNGAG